MADEKVGEAAEAVAAEGGGILLIPNPEAEAQEHGNGAALDVPPYAGMVAAHDVKLVELEQRIATCEADHNAMWGGIEGRAMAAHEHPQDDDLRIISEELRALREEEVAPRRGRLPQRGWLKRWLRGGNG